MRRLSRTNNLRLGLILMVTGIIALAHALFSSSHHLGTRPTFIIAIVLVVLGLPLLVAALRSHGEARSSPVPCGLHARWPLLRVRSEDHCEAKPDHTGS